MTLTFDFSYFIKALLQLILFIPFTLWLTFCSLVLGSLLGTLLTVGKLSKNGVIRKISFGYTTVIRSTPTIVLLFLIYYGLPILFHLFGQDINRIPTSAFVIITFALYTGSYLSELFRSSYLAVSGGQFEAAVSVGLSSFQAIRRIVLPQALLIALPNLGNTVITTMKEMSLAFTIGTLDLLGQANIILANEYSVHTLEVYTAAAALYWLLCFFFEKLSGAVERRTSKHLKKASA